MPAWHEFETVAPALAQVGRRLFADRGGEALLATVNSADAPRIHPVNVGIVDGHLYTFIIGSSPKRVDLESDGRYAIHSHVDPIAPSEFSVRGHGSLVEDVSLRSSVGSQWPFSVDESYYLFELFVETAILGERSTADEWPPRYSSWKGGQNAAARS